MVRAVVGEGLWRVRGAWTWRRGRGSDGAGVDWSGAGYGPVMGRIGAGAAEVAERAVPPFEGGLQALFAKVDVLLLGGRAVL